MTARRSLGVGVIGLGWMGQAHSRSMRRIPSLFPERTFDPRLVICADSAPVRFASVGVTSGIALFWLGMHRR